MKLMHTVVACLIALSLYNVSNEVVMSFMTSNAAEYIAKDTGCDVVRDSPGRRRGCQPFNIGSRTRYVQAWLCCP